MATVIKIYLCSKCGFLIKSKSSPKGYECENSGNLHSWRILGEEGEKKFCCKNCLTYIQVKDFPTKLGCPKLQFHIWENI